MKVLKNRNYYLDFYVFFLRSEIPGIIQIIGIPSLFGVFLKVKFFAIIIINIIIAYLLQEYLFAKLRFRLEGEIKDEFSLINRYRLDDEILMLKIEKYTLITSLVLGFLTAVVVSLIVYSV